MRNMLWGVCCAESGEWVCDVVIGEGVGPQSFGVRVAILTMGE